MSNTEFLQRIGMEMKIARVRKNLSIADISEITGLTNGAVSSIENGKTDSKMLTYKRIADALEIEMNQIFLTL